MPMGKWSSISTTTRYDNKPLPSAAHVDSASVISHAQHSEAMPRLIVSRLLTGTRMPMPHGRSGKPVAMENSRQWGGVALRRIPRSVFQRRFPVTNVSDSRIAGHRDWQSDVLLRVASAGLVSLRLNHRRWNQRRPVHSRQCPFHFGLHPHLSRSVCAACHS